MVIDTTHAHPCIQIASSARIITLTTLIKSIFPIIVKIVTITFRRSEPSFRVIPTSVAEYFILTRFTGILTGETRCIRQEIPISTFRTINRIGTI